MYKFIQRNQKKFLAVFAAGLMIVFILPNTGILTGGGGQGGMDAANAVIGGRDVSYSEVAASREAWERLKNFKISPFHDAPYVYHLGPQLVQQIENEPDLFFLLQEEARQAGIAVSPERIQTVMEKDFAVRPGTTGGAAFQNLEAALKRFLLVKSYADRLASNVKISEPLVRHELAIRGQEMKLNLVDLSADAFKDAVEPPTEEDLKAHFQKHVYPPAATTAPTTVEAEAEGLTFNYRYPDRIKFQYLAIPREQVEERVRNSKDPYEWEVQARQYYLENKEQFPVRPPAEKEPATEDITPAPTETPAPTDGAKPDRETELEDPEPATTPEAPAEAPPSEAPAPEATEPAPPAEAPAPDAPAAPDASDGEGAAAPADSPAPDAGATPPADNSSEEPAEPSARTSGGNVTLAAFFQDEKAAAPAGDADAAAPAPDSAPAQAAPPDAPAEAPEVAPTDAPAAPPADAPADAPATPTDAAPVDSDTDAPAADRPADAALPKDAPAPLAPADIPPATGDPRTTAPAYQSFDEAKDEILDIIMEPEVTRLMADLQNKIAQRLAADYAAYQKAGQKESDFPSFAYLERVADQIQKDHQIRPVVTSVANEWTPVNGLSAVPGIGRSFSGQSSFSEIAASAQPLADPDAPKNDDRLALHQFSKPLKDFSGNVYFFRITDAQRAHAPENVAEVQDRVKEDVIVARAYEKARAEAERLLEKAKEEGLPSAANAAEHELITTGTFDQSILGGGGQFMPEQPIPNYKASPEAKLAVVRAAYDLLTKATPDQPHPRTVVKIPGERKVVVAELASVNSKFRDDMAYFMELQLGQSMAAQATQSLVAEYLSYPAVARRLGYATDAEEQTPPAEPS